MTWQVQVFQLEPCEDSHNCHVWKEVEIFGDEEEAEVEKIPLSVLVLLDKVMMIMSVTYNFKEDGDNIGKDEKLG